MIKDVLHDAKKRHVAVGHFNISDSTQFNAIVDAAVELNLPVIIGVSEGEEDFLRIENAVALVRAARTARGTPVFLNADHHHTTEACKKAIDAGFDSVIFDGVKLSLEENIAKTKEVVEYARRTEEETGRQIVVEAELGYIGTSSKLLDKIPDDVLQASLPTPEQARDFVEQTGVDALAPAVGNLHGMLKGMSNPQLQIDLIKRIRQVLPDTHLVLHGGSGVSDEDFKEAVSAGMNCVHINTEIRKAYRFAIEESLRKDPEQIAPYKYFAQGHEEVKETVRNRLRLFAGIDY